MTLAAPSAGAAGERRMADAAAGWRALAAWASGPLVLSPRALDETEDAVIDTLACLLAGLDQPAAQAARASATGTGRGTLAGGGSAAPDMAAFAHATAAHALDFDDYEAPGISHPSAVLVPAVLAVGEAEGSDGLAMLEALAVGVEAIMATGRLVNPVHYERGFHATGTLGTFGAAAAAARLMRLEPAGTLHALALAAGFAAGLKAQFGTPAKPLNAGLAARNGVAAATLARHGVTAAEGALSGPEGFVALFGDPAAPVRVPGLPGPLLGIETPGLIRKRWPCCGYLARILDGIETLGLDAHDVERIEIEAPARNAGVLRFALPTTPDQARFSAPYCVAAMLLGGLGPADFTPAAIARAEVLDLARRIVLKASSAPQGPEDLSPDDPDVIRVSLRSGRTLQRVCTRLPGAPDHPLGRAALLGKLAICGAGRLPAAALDPEGGGLAVALTGFRRLTDAAPVLAPLAGIRLA